MIRPLKQERRDCVNARANTMAKIRRILHTLGAASTRQTETAVDATPVVAFSRAMKSVATWFLAAFSLLMNTASAADAPYRHVVLFKFVDTATPEHIQAVEQAFKALPSRIDTIVSFEWGTNVSPEGKSDGFTHCFFVTFRDKAGLEVYLPHPAHKEFGASLKGILDKVCVIDYVAQQ